MPGVRSVSAWPFNNGATMGMAWRAGFAPMLRALAALFSLLLLAGCLGAAPAPQKAAQTSAPRVANVSVDDGSAAPNATLGAKPHMHDYWKGRERVTILDKPVSFSPTNQTFLVPLVLEGRPALGATVVRLPDGQTVYEGTGRIEFTATWTDPDITGLQLRVKPSGVAKIGEPTALENGKALSIPVTPQMTDEPHATSSQWAFVLEAAGPGGAGIAAGSVGVKADIVKMRDIETFPAHPDLFEGKDSLKIFDADETIKSQSPVDGLQQDPSQLSGGFALTHPVPPDAKTLLVRLEIKQATSQNPVADPTSIHLGYKAASTAFFWQEAPAAKRDAKVMLFKMPVNAGQGDSYYAKESQWRLWPYHQDDAGPVPVWCMVGDCFSWQLDVHATVYAFKNDVGIDALPTT